MLTAPERLTISAEQPSAPVLATAQFCNPLRPAASLATHTLGGAAVARTTHR